MHSMETLTLQKMTNKTNKMLELLIRYDPAFITNNGISFPLHEISVRRWMEDLCFKHSAVKNYCMATAHEIPDS